VRILSAKCQELLLLFFPHTVIATHCRGTSSDTYSSNIAQSSQELLEQHVRILSARCQELSLLSRSQSETIEDLERQLANQNAVPQVFHSCLLLWLYQSAEAQEVHPVCPVNPLQMGH
jgi:hypothetical protein